jgi:transcriptional regulator with XRE-family HTH domain
VVLENCRGGGGELVGSIKPTIINNIRKAIKDSGLKQYVVAKKCGYTGKGLSDLLNGRRSITADDIYKLCKGIGISPNELFGYNEKTPLQVGVV